MQCATTAMISRAKIDTKEQDNLLSGGGTVAVPKEHGEDWCQS
jgi:hypothetical protein